MSLIAINLTLIAIQLRNAKIMLEHALLAPVIAHRGASGTAPENTLAAIGLASDHGAQCVELDASISADGVPFVHHDDTLERCTNGTDYLCAHAAQDLDSLFASNGIAGYESEPLPRLSACIQLLTKLNLGLNLEIKPTPGLEEPTAQAVCEVLRDSWPGDLPLVLSSFSRESLKVAQHELPGAARALIVCAVPDTWHDQVQLLQCSNLHVAASLLTADQAAAITGSGLGLYCFTVNEVNQAKALFDMGVHGVFSDYPKTLLNT